MKYNLLKYSSRNSTTYIVTSHLNHVQTHIDTYIFHDFLVIKLIQLTKAIFFLATKKFTIYIKKIAFFTNSNDKS